MGRSARSLSALASLLTPRASGKVAEDAGVFLREDSPERVLLLARPLPGDALAAAKEALGAADLPLVGRTAGERSIRLLGIAPNRWLMVRESGAADSEAMAPSALARAFALITEMSDAWTRIRISGPAVLDLLAKGSALDLEPRFFPAGSCACAPFARMPTILHRAEMDGPFDLYVGRSYALSLFQWLTEAAAEFGGEPSSERENAASTGGM